MTKLPTFTENRTLHRIPCRIVVSRRDRTAPIGEIHNLSLDGMFVATNDAPPEGSVFPVAFDLGGPHLDGSKRGTPEVVATIEVVRRTAEGFGARILETSPAHGKLLRRHVADMNSVVGHRDSAARLLDVEGRTSFPIADSARIVELLSRSLRESVALTLIPADRPIRESATIVSVDGGRIVLETAAPTELGGGESIFVLCTVDFVSYTFATRVLEAGDRRLAASLPRSVHYSERRSSKRESRPAENVDIVIEVPGVRPRRLRWPVLETSDGGLSFKVETDSIQFLPGTPLTTAVLFDQGRETPLEGAVVRHVTAIESDASTWIRVGVAHGVSRAEAAVERQSVNPPPPASLASKIAASLRSVATKASYLYHTRLKVKPQSKNGKSYHIVRFDNTARHPVVGILNTTFPEDARVRAPLVIIVPGFGSRKESLAAMAHTLIHNFRRNSRDLAVLRIDLSNHLGESYKDPDCRAEGKQTLHFSVEGSVQDVLGSLRWAHSNQFVEPTDIVIISASFSSIAVRHVLTLPESAEVSKWICFMGAPDAANAIMHVSGHVDAYGNYLRGIHTGVVTLNGCMVDSEKFCENMHDLGVATLEDSRREMSKVKASTSWLLGKYDAWMDPARVQDVMNVSSPGFREIIEVDAGHLPRSGEEALREFCLVTRLLWKHLYSSEISPQIPPQGWLGALIAAEWQRVRGNASLDRESFWSDYLLGSGGFSFDVLTYTDEYRDFVSLQVGLADVEGKQVVDLGCGTGNLTIELLRHQPKSITSIDFVAGAIERTKNKLGDRATSVECRVADIDGGPLTAVRRYGRGELPSLNSLVGRVPGLSEGAARAIAQRMTPAIHAALRGNTIDVKRASRQAGLPSEVGVLVEDINVLALAARGVLPIRDAISRLQKVPSTTVGPRVGIPLDDSSADVIVSSLVLSYMEHPGDVLSEIHRVLRPRGRVVISSMLPDTDSSAIFMNLLTKLDRMSDAEFASGPSRDAIKDAARGFANRAAGLLRLEEQALFKFFTGAALCELLVEAGFVDVGEAYGFGRPAQAVVVHGRRP